jgi:hypothetical protein
LVQKNAGSLCWRLVPRVDFSCFESDLSYLYSFHRIIPLLGERLLELRAAPAAFLDEHDLEHLSFNCRNLTSLTITNLLFETATATGLTHLGQVLRRLKSLTLIHNFTRNVYSHSNQMVMGNWDESGDSKTDSALVRPSEWLRSQADFMKLEELTIIEGRSPNARVYGLQLKAMLGLGRKTVKRLEIPAAVEQISLLKKMEALEKVTFGAGDSQLNVDHFFKSYVKLNSATRNLGFNLFSGERLPILMKLIMLPDHCFAEELLHASPAVNVGVEAISATLEASIRSYNPLFFESLLKFLSREDLVGRVPSLARVLHGRDCRLLVLDFLSSRQPVFSLDEESLHTILQVLFIYFEAPVQTEPVTTQTLASKHLIDCKRSNFLWTICRRMNVSTSTVRILMHYNLLGHEQSLIERDEDGFSLAHIAVYLSSVRILREVFDAETFAMFYTHTRSNSGQRPLEHLLQRGRCVAASEVMETLSPQTVGLETQHITEEAFFCCIKAIWNLDHQKEWFDYFMKSVDLRNYSHATIFKCIEFLCDQGTPGKAWNVTGWFFRDIQAAGLSLDTMEGWLNLALSRLTPPHGSIRYLFNTFPHLILKEAKTGHFGGRSLIPTFLEMLELEHSMRQHMEQGGKVEWAAVVFDLYKLIFEQWLLTLTPAGSCQVAFLLNSIWQQNYKRHRTVSPKEQESYWDPAKFQLLNFAEFALEIEFGSADEETAAKKRLHLLNTLTRMASNAKLPSIVAAIRLCLPHLRKEDFDRQPETNKLASAIANGECDYEREIMNLLAEHGIVANKA